jgi:hypothetical protein
MSATEKNKTGTQHEKGAVPEAEEQLKYDTHREALAYYEIFKQRFLHVNSWKRYTGKTGIKFHLAGIEGNLIENEEAKEGFLIRIDIPHPGYGSEHDWVRIELISDEYDPLKDAARFSMRVRAISTPDVHNPEITHFSAMDSTNTFTLHRVGVSIKASVSGSDENYQVQPLGFWTRLKNRLMGIFNSSGSSHSFWKIFLKGLLDKK